MKRNAQRFAVLCTLGVLLGCRGQLLPASEEGATSEPTQPELTSEVVDEEACEVSFEPVYEALEQFLALESAPARTILEAERSAPSFDEEAVLEAEWSQARAACGVFPGPTDDDNDAVSILRANIEGQRFATCAREQRLRPSFYDDLTRRLADLAEALGDGADAIRKRTDRAEQASLEALAERFDTTEGASYDEVRTMRDAILSRIESPEEFAERAEARCGALVPWSDGAPAETRDWLLDRLTTLRCARRLGSTAEAWQRYLEPVRESLETAGSRTQGRATEAVGRVAHALRADR